jgi:hypothetical protein
VPARAFAIVLNGRVVGLFDTLADAETAMQNLIPPDPPGTLKVIKRGDQRDGRR